MAGAQAERPLAISGPGVAGRQSPQAVHDGPCHQPAEPENRDAVSGAAAAVHRSRGRQRAGQSVVFGSIQIVISVSVNAMIALTAGSITGYLAARPMWLKAQRWLMGTVLA